MIPIERTYREYTDGSKEWLVNGRCHREDGPAIEYADGSKYWYINGKYHREDGPAVVYADGSKFWYFDGDEYSFDEWLDKLQISDEEKVMLCLIWK